MPRPRLSAIRRPRSASGPVEGKRCHNRPDAKRDKANRQLAPMASPSAMPGAPFRAAAITVASSSGSAPASSSASAKVETPSWTEAVPRCSAKVSAPQTMAATPARKRQTQRTIIRLLQAPSLGASDDARHDNVQARSRAPACDVDIAMIPPPCLAREDSADSSGGKPSSVPVVPPQPRAQAQPQLPPRRALEDRSLARPWTTP